MSTSTFELPSYLHRQTNAFSSFLYLTCNLVCCDKTFCTLHAIWFAVIRRPCYVAKCWSLITTIAVLRETSQDPELIFSKSLKNLLFHKLAFQSSQDVDSCNAWVDCIRASPISGQVTKHKKAQTIWLYYYEWVNDTVSHGPNSQTKH